ncbi:SDR family oxidoreductase [Nesterenkonia ebinurensis]|uniref:SDR family oxidoreductase n=1 Tax=Nesterenkonia ebinurensis TaxID=2608252 RepID=UPI0021DF569C|nr:SDR family NAD(P)-dependent oxidoreductase [Nesterenkonia ebinurensis]
MLRLAIDTHLITTHHALPLLIKNEGGLVVEITDGTEEYNASHYRLSAFYDLAKSAPIRLAKTWARELVPHRGTAVCVTPGWLRSEMMLDHFGVTEETWQKPVPTSRTSRYPRHLGISDAASPP